MSAAATRAFLVVFAGLLLHFAPLLLADVPFRDDTIRALTGQLFWDNSGRQLARLLFEALTFSDGVDVWPLTLLEAIAFMAAGLLAASLLVRGRIDPAFVAAAALAFTCPFFLQNMAYRFDCLPMAIAAAACLVAAAAAVARPRGTRALRVGLLGGTLFVFQPAYGLYAAAVVVLLADRFAATPRRTAGRAELAALARALALPALLGAAYALCFGRLTTGDAGRGALCLACAPRNLAALARATATLLGHPLLALVLLAVPIGLALRSRLLTPSGAAATAAAIALAWAASGGGGLLLREAPAGVRVFAGAELPVAIALLLLGRTHPRAAAAATAAVLLWNASWSARFANFLVADARPTDLVLARLAGDLARLPGLTRVAVVDAPPLPPEARVMLARAPALGLLAETGADRWLAEVRLAALTDQVAFGTSCAVAAGLARGGPLAVALATRDYTIRRRGPAAVVDFGTAAATEDSCVPP